MKNTLVLMLAIAAGTSFGQTSKNETPPVNGEIKIGPVSVSVSTSASVTSSAGKMEPYLGVGTQPVSAELRAQLGLAEGMGLSIESVAKGSPAEKAGVQQYDVLKKFNDQLVTSPAHLTTLVKAAGNGAHASLTVVRKGAEQVLEATIAEHAATDADATSFSISGAGGPGVTIRLDNLAEQLTGILGGIQDRSAAQKAPGDDAEVKEFRAHREEHEKEIRDAADKAREEIERKAREAVERARENARKLEPRAGGQAYSFRPRTHSQSTVVWREGDLEVQIHETDGKRNVQITDGGAEVFSGSLNTDQDRAALPEKYRDKVREAEKSLKKPEPKGEGRPKASI